MSCRGVICLLGFLQRLLGNNNAKEIKKMRAIADHINEIEPNYVGRPIGRSICCSS